MSSKKRQGQFFYIVKLYTAKEKSPQATRMTCLWITGRHRLNGDFSFGLKKYCAATAKNKSRMSLKRKAQRREKK